MKLFVYNHSGYGYIIRATDAMQAAKVLCTSICTADGEAMLLTRGGEYDPKTQAELAQRLEELEINGPPGILMECPG